MAFTVYVSRSSDTYIQKTKKSYIDSRARRNLGSINTELQDVQRIMVANIEEVLQRGEALSGEFKLLQIPQALFRSLIHHVDLTQNNKRPWFVGFCIQFCLIISPFSHFFQLLLPFLRFSSLQHSTPRPATCPACQRSTGVMPSIWIHAPPMPSWQLVVSFSLCSSSMYASGGSEKEREKKKKRMEALELHRVCRH